MKVGFPRPWSPNYKVPVPYTAKDIDAVSAISESRVKRCTQRGLCTVCGERITEDFMFLAIFKFKWSSEKHGDTGDPGFAHERCAKLVKAQCPHFKDPAKAEFIKVSRKSIFSLYRKMSKKPRYLGNVTLSEIKGAMNIQEV